MYTLKRGVECPLVTHPTIYGLWKSEIPKDQIVSQFTSLGVKNYALEFQEIGKNIYHNQVKLRGFNLTSIRAKKKITANLMQEFLEALVADDVSKEVCVDQFTIKIDKTHNLQNHNLIKKYSNNTITKRVLNTKLHTNCTFPFGYTVPQ